MIAINEAKKLVGYCGIYCGSCGMYRGRIYAKIAQEFWEIIKAYFEIIKQNESLTRRAFASMIIIDVYSNVFVG